MKPLKTPEEINAYLQIMRSLCMSREAINKIRKQFGLKEL
jgi:hypothetical protein